MLTSWQQVEVQVASCRACPLCGGRTQTVLGEGDPAAPLMLIGEGPGQQEDLTGRPFVGPAGQLLDRMLLAIGLRRAEVYICNIVKCRPPGNRTPLPEECQACLPHLRAQFALVRPRVVLLLGATAARTILGEDLRITRDRGVWKLKKGVWMLPTYHPSALLRDPSKKRPAWEDMKALAAKLHALGLYSGSLDETIIGR